LNIQKSGKEIFSGGGGQLFPPFNRKSTWTGKMKRRNVYSGDFKAKVVLEAIKGDNNLDELAKRYCLHPNLIKNWKSMFMKRAKYVLEDRRRKTTRANDFMESH
jgi:transposase-like protein